MNLFRRYTRIALINLLVVAVLGFILRYKIAFSFPFFNQKLLLHGHSHFAFAGWVTHTLMFLLLSDLSKHFPGKVKKYKPVIIANLITALGMCIFLTWKGYTMMGIFFSTTSIFVAYAFAIMYWRDLKTIPAKVSHKYFKAALIFNVISSIGAFTLAGMMATKQVHQDVYLASVYFFLHFQYNGWFLFVILGLAVQAFLPLVNIITHRKIFWLFAAACIPAYLLSALWLPFPNWMYVIVVIAAFSQTIAWTWLARLLMKNSSSIIYKMPLLVRWLLLFSALAMSIKIFLQLASVIPALSTFAFGFRPIIIGYLHLILLGVITLFLLAWMVYEKHIANTSVFRKGIIVFTTGIILNEFFLLIQGVSAMSYTVVPYINEALVFAAFLLVAGMVVVNFSQRRRTGEIHQ